jgi:hypothetical protein
MLASRLHCLVGPPSAWPLVEQDIAAKLSAVNLHDVASVLRRTVYIMD